jgi:hypothetical protein
VKTTTTTTGTTSPSTTTTALPATTTTMNYCTQQNGMNQPLTITPEQVISNPPPQSTTPLSGINPTSTTPGLDFPTPNPQINVTLDQPTTLTVVYLPIDRPDKPSNVVQFQVEFVYPNGTTSTPFNSTTASIPSTTSTSTTPPSAGSPPPTSTSPSVTTIVPPSDVSPKVNLPANFYVPEDTTIVITITSTIGGSNPTGVSKHFSSHFIRDYRAYVTVLFLTSILNLRDKNE